jgi:hypothetical protein
MKHFFTLLMSVFVVTVLQAQARVSSVKFSKDGEKPSVTNDYIYSEKTVAKAIDDKFGKMGYKGKDNKGFTVYRGVNLPALSGGPYDLYFKVDRNGKRSDENATVYMLISKGNEQFISEADDNTLMNDAKTYLDSLTNDIAAYDLEQQISKEEDDLKKAEKKYENLMSNAENLQKQKKKIENDIEDNLQAQKNQQSTIEKQKQVTENLRAKRKS